MMRRPTRMLLLVATLVFALVTPMASLAGPWDPECLYPSANERFGFTGGRNIATFGPEVLSAGGYLNWTVIENPAHPGNMIYYPMFHTRNSGYWPEGELLRTLVRALPGSLWVVGNESGTVWMDNTTPEFYAQYLHEIVTAVREIDPEAMFAFGGTATVSTLRLAWLDRAWNAYRSMYGTDMPIDVWNIHTYRVNEMHNEWGAEIPTGIPNAVGYTNGNWTELADSGASGGTVHRSRTRGAHAYFAYHGDQVTVYLRTGPDAGIAELAADPNLVVNGQPVGQFSGPIDLYSPTPGTRTVTFSNLVHPGGLRGDRHNVRITVTGDKNPASSNTWIRVDAMAAPSTADLPGGRLQDNSELRARIVSDVNDHDNVDLIEEQIRMFRQWMADHGQRSKPLINTEYGILMTEDLGFDEARVRQFMAESFDRFMNDWTDPDLGYPEDGNRMLQQLFWFSLAIDEFEGRTVHTGLFDENTRQIKPLGLDYAAFVTPLVEPYADLATTSVVLTPTWSLFAGDPSVVELATAVRNWGNSASGPFTIGVDSSGQPVHTWTLTGLDARFESNDRIHLTHAWNEVITADRVVDVTADDGLQVNDPCRHNNNRSVTLEAPSFTDLAVANLTTVPRVLPPVPPGETAPIPLQFRVSNLGSQGTAAPEVIVRLWNGDPDNGGVPIFSEVLTPGNVDLPQMIEFVWPDRTPGSYQIVAEVVPVAEETNLANNRQSLSVFLPPFGNTFLPMMKKGRGVRDLVPAPELVPEVNKLQFMIPARR